MNFTFSKKIFSKKNLFILFLFLSFFSNFNFAKQVTFDKSVNSSYLKKIPKNDYILGEGDTLNISIVKDVPEFNIESKIDASGTIILPRLNRIFVKGLSIKELKEIL